MYVHSGMLHLDRTSVRDNTAVEGAGVCLAGGSRLTASRSQLGGNHLASSGDEHPEAAAGADLLLADGGNSAAYLEPMPQDGELSGELQRHASSWFQEGVARMARCSASVAQPGEGQGCLEQMD